jgi:thiol-disulfide isomerase/thioredoxin
MRRAIIKRCCIVTAGIILCFKGVSQTLKVGDPFPSIIATDVINYGDSLLRFNDLSCPLIILNFWNQGCEANMDAFPKLDSLQKIFKGELQLVMVNRERKDSTLRFFSKRKRLVLPAIPMVTGGEKLWKLFTNSSIPYQVWIHDGKVAYITNSYNLSRRHIEGVLAGKRPVMINLPDEEGKQIPEWQRFLYSSSLSSCSKGRKDMGDTEGVIDGTLISLSSSCVSAVDLFIKAYREYNKHAFRTTKEVVLDADNPFRYTYPPQDDEIDEWKPQYSYTYQLVLPISLRKSRYQFMQQDLKRYFPLEAKIEKRKIKCYALVRTGSLQALASKGGKRIDRLLPTAFLKDGDSSRYARNFPFSSFAAKVGQWIEYFLDMPFEDKTNYGGSIDIDLREADIDPFNLDELQKDFLRYHLKIVLSEKLMDVLVLKEKKKGE